MTNTALQRKNMVESQVRPSDVTDRRITSAMQDIPRENFVPAALRAVAYMDDPLSVAPGRSLLAPRTCARLLQLASIEATDKVLIVGALAGYTAAIAGRLAAEVTAIEADDHFVRDAKAALDAAKIENVSIVKAALSSGFADRAPYDVIFIEGGFEKLPDDVLGQLRVGGRLVGIDVSGGVGRAVCVEVVMSNGQRASSRRVAFEASAVCLPGFQLPNVFTF